MTPPHKPIEPKEPSPTIQITDTIYLSGFEVDSHYNSEDGHSVQMNLGSLLEKAEFALEEYNTKNGTYLNLKGVELYIEYDFAKLLVPKTIPNPRYKSELKAYEKKKRKYDQNLIEYNARLEEYKRTEKDREFIKKENEIKKLELEKKKLEKQLNKLKGGNNAKTT